MKMLVYGYVRSSSETSTQNQISLINKKAKELELTVKQHITDYRELIKIIEEGSVDTLIVADKTRISRNAGEISNFIDLCHKHNTELIFIN